MYTLVLWISVPMAATVSTKVSDHWFKFTCERAAAKLMDRLGHRSVYSYRCIKT